MNPAKPAPARPAADAAHDLNNLLTVISGTADAVRLGLAEDPAVALLSICDACGRASALARSLMRLCRGPAPASAATAAGPAELCGLVRKSRAALSAAVGPSVALTVRPGQDEAWVRADPAELEQVLLNLAVNARDAMPGGGELRVEVGRESDRWAVLRCADSGCGMSEEERVRAFDPYFTTKPAGKGTGLGLPMVRETVRRAGGRVELDSRPGAGTTLQLFFPLARPPAGFAGLAS